MFILALAVFFAVLLMFVKLPHRWLLRMLKYDLLVDFTVSAIVLLIHFGSFEGVMIATLAGLFTSVATSGAKRLFGYIDGGVYHHGYMRLNVGGK